MKHFVNILLFSILGFVSTVIGHPVPKDGKQVFFGVKSDAKNETVTINFDDISLYGSPNRSLSSYDMFEFKNFEVVNATAAVEAKLISPDDADSAVSAPNFIRNVIHERKQPSLIISNATALAAGNKSEYFDLLSMNIKPMGIVRRGDMISISVWEIDDKTPVNVYTIYIIFLRDEHMRPLHLVFERLVRNRRWGKHVNWIELEMVSRKDEPWPFAVDDLEVVFYPLDDGDGEKEVMGKDRRRRDVHILEVE